MDRDNWFWQLVLALLVPVFIFIPEAVIYVVLGVMHRIFWLLFGTYNSTWEWFIEKPLRLIILYFINAAIVLMIFLYGEVTRKRESWEWKDEDKGFEIGCMVTIGLILILLIGNALIEFAKAN